MRNYIRKYWAFIVSDFLLLVAITLVAGVGLHASIWQIIGFDVIAVAMNINGYLMEGSK